MEFLLPWCFFNHEASAWLMCSLNSWFLHYCISSHKHVFGRPCQDAVSRYRVVLLTMMDPYLHMRYVLNSPYISYNSIHFQIDPLVLFLVSCTFVPLYLASCILILDKPIHYSLGLELVRLVGMTHKFGISWFKLYKISSGLLRLWNPSPFSKFWTKFENSTTINRLSRRCTKTFSPF